MKTPKRANKPPGLVDWSWLRWRWSGMEILMLIGVLVTLGAIAVMLWGTLQDFIERGPAVGGGTTASESTGSGAGADSGGGQ